MHHAVNAAEVYENAVALNGFDLAFVPFAFFDFVPKFILDRIAFFLERSAD
jgi:hypothetical protein